MNKPALYFLTLATATVATSCNKTPEDITLKTKNNEGETLELRLKADRGTIWIPDSIITILNLTDNTKIIYVNEGRPQGQNHYIVDKITTYKTAGRNNEIILKDTKESYIKGQNPNLTDSLFIASDKDWRKKANLFKEVKQRELQTEQDRLNAKKESEYNAAKQKVYKTIDAIQR